MLSLLANCDDGDVRLLRTSGSEKEGTALVCINRRWGPICSNRNEANGKTMCHQLGYAGGKHQCWSVILYTVEPSVLIIFNKKGYLSY